MPLPLIHLNYPLGTVTLKLKKKGNWRTLIINANGVLNKKAEIAAIIDYCDPDLMLFTETKIDSCISFSEFLPNWYNGEFRRDRCKNGGGIMIVTKQEYTITDLDLLTPSQHNSESIWASISLKDHSKIVVGSFYRPPRQSLLSLHMTKSYVRTATHSTLKVEANLTQILNFKANFHTEFEPFFKKKNYANNGGHFKIVSIKLKN